MGQVRVHIGKLQVYCRNSVVQCILLVCGDHF